MTTQTVHRSFSFTFSSRFNYQELTQIYIPGLKSGSIEELWKPPTPFPHQSSDQVSFIITISVTFGLNCQPQLNGYCFTLAFYRHLEEWPFWTAIKAYPSCNCWITHHRNAFSNTCLSQASVAHIGHTSGAVTKIIACRKCAFWLKKICFSLNL